MKIGKNKKVNINPIPNMVIMTLFLLEIINEDVKRPNQAFLEKVKNAAIPTEIRSPKLIIPLKKEFLFSIKNIMHNGQIKFSHVPA